MKKVLITISLCITAVATQAQTQQIDSTKININNFYGDFDQYSFKMNQPLFILGDMAISMDSLNKIKPENIESLEILKGKDTEPYGEKGKNGVIIINLRQIRKPD